MIEGYRDLCRVTDAAYQSDLARMQRLTADEQNLRATLNDLDRQLRDSLAEASDSETPWRAIGADEAWRKWLMRRRSEVNMQLARVMAAKGEAMTALRRSLARKQVSGDILNLKISEFHEHQKKRF